MLPVLGTLFTGVLLLPGTPPADVLSLTAALALVAALTVLTGRAVRDAAAGSPPAVTAGSVPTAAAGQAYRVPRLSDPDAPGRARPRAPTTNPAA